VEISLFFLTGANTRRLKFMDESPHEPKIRLQYQEDFIKYFKKRNEFSDVHRFRKSDKLEHPLAAAVKCSEENGYMPVFGFQYGKSTAREFIVCGYNQLWEELNSLDPAKVAYHEIVRGMCNLYIDAEYWKHLNPDYDDEEMIHRVREAVRTTMKKYLKICPLDEEMFGSVSHDKDKFSYHLVVQLTSKKCMFLDASTCKLFAQEIDKCASGHVKGSVYVAPGTGLAVIQDPPTKNNKRKISNKHHKIDAHDSMSQDISNDCWQNVTDSIPSDEEDDEEIIRSDGKHKNDLYTKSILDLGVYSEGRSLRTVYSTKPECPYRPLLPHTVATPPAKQSQTLGADRSSRTKNRFLNRLVCYYPGNSKLEYIICANVNAETNEVSFERQKIELNPHVILPKCIQSKQSHEPSSTITYEGTMFAGKSYYVGEDSKRKRLKKTVTDNPIEFKSTSATCSAPRFVHEIADHFIQTKFNINGKITIKYDKDRQEVMYTTRDNNCPFAGRPHGGKTKHRVNTKGYRVKYLSPGNNVYFKLYLMRGYLIQFCFSYNCKGKRSARIPLPHKYKKELIAHNIMIDSQLECLTDRLCGTLDLLM